MSWRLPALGWSLCCLLLAAAQPVAAEDEGAGTPSESAATNSASPSKMELLDDKWSLNIGDRVLYEVIEDQAEEPVLLTVDGNGEIFVPLIGSVDAEGKTLRTLGYEIKRQLEKEYYYRATVSMYQREGDRNLGRVTVYGEVVTQGDLLIPAGKPMTLSGAIIRAGGFTRDADTDSVSYIPGGNEDARTVVNVGAMLESGNFEGDPVLKAGDVIIVAEADATTRQIYILGAVEQPGLYDLTGDGITVSQAILRAGGFTRFARDNKVRLLRHSKSGDPKDADEIVVNVRKVLEDGDRSEDREVEAGDMIVVDEKMISFSG